MRYVISRLGIEGLGSTFGSILPSISYELVGGHACGSPGESLAPSLRVDLRVKQKTILGQWYFIKCTVRLFPKSVHILGMPMLYQLTCMAYDHGGPGLQYRCILGG